MRAERIGKPKQIKVGREKDAPEINAWVRIETEQDVAKSRELSLRVVTVQNTRIRHQKGIHNILFQITSRLRLPDYETKTTGKAIGSLTLNISLLFRTFIYSGVNLENMSWNSLQNGQKRGGVDGYTAKSGE